jgi:hypothetical protein
MQLDQIQGEIERMRIQVHRQRGEIRQLQRAGISTVSAKALLERILNEIDELCTERADPARDGSGPGGVLVAVRGQLSPPSRAGLSPSGPVTNSALLISQPFIPPEGWRGKRETVSETRGLFRPKTLRRGGCLGRMHSDHHRQGRSLGCLT